MADIQEIKQAVHTLREMLKPSEHLLEQVTQDAREREIITLFSDLNAVSVLIGTATDLLDDLLLASGLGIMGDYEDDEIPT